MWGTWPDHSSEVRSPNIHITDSTPNIPKPMWCSKLSVIWMWTLTGPCGKWWIWPKKYGSALGHNFAFFSSYDHILIFYPHVVSNSPCSRVFLQKYSSWLVHFSGGFLRWQNTSSLLISPFHWKLQGEVPPKKWKSSPTYFPSSSLCSQDYKVWTSVLCWSSGKQRKRAASPVPSCVSMKSSMSMEIPLAFKRQSSETE